VWRVVARRWHASFGSPRNAALILLVIAALLMIEYVALRRSRNGSPIGALRVLAARPARAAAMGVALLGVIGLLANDSGLLVPWTMLCVAVPVVVLRYDSWIERAGDVA
jgi:hypothetical protein